MVMHCPIFCKCYAVALQVTITEDKEMFDFLCSVSEYRWQGINMRGAAGVASARRGQGYLQPDTASSSWFQQPHCRTQLRPVWHLGEHVFKKGEK